MSVNQFKQRISDSAIDFALNAFWVAVVGAVMTGLVAAYAILKGLPERWVWAVTASFLTFSLVLLATVALVRVARRHRDLPRVVGRRGLLDFVRDRDRALAEVNRNLTRLSRQTARIGVETTRRTVQMQFANRVGWEWLKYWVAERTARDLRRRALTMELHATRFSDGVELFGESATSWLSWLKTRGQVIQPAELLRGINALRSATSGAMTNTRGFRDAADNNRAFSAELDVAGGYVVAALDKVLAAMERAIYFCDEISAGASSLQGGDGSRDVRL